MMKASKVVLICGKLQILNSFQYISETVGDKLHCQEGNSPDH